MWNEACGGAAEVGGFSVRTTTELQLLKEGR